MLLTEAAGLAVELMGQHNLLPRWKFEFDGSKRRFGQTRYMDSTISLSRYLVELNTVNEVRQTILHEIAHAMLPPGTGHSDTWRRTLSRIGGIPARCYDTPLRNVVKVAKPYKAICPVHGELDGYFRKPKGIRYCELCWRGSHKESILTITDIAQGAGV
jgi:predicted SprT family Zn-dependent metalloprotease